MNPPSARSPMCRAAAHRGSFAIASEERCARLGLRRALRSSLWALLLIGSMPGCEQAQPPATPSATTTASTTAVVPLGTIPPPTLAGLDTQVAADLAAAYKDWEEALANRATLAEQAQLAGSLGELALAYEQNDLASAALGWASRAEPKNSRWWYLRAQSESGGGDNTTALSHLHEAVRLAPDYAPARWQLADRLLKAQQFDEAEILLGPNAAREPAALLGLRGRLALARKDFEPAAEFLQAALKAEPTATRLQYPLGLALRALGKEAAAREALGRRGEVAPVVDDPILDQVRALASGARVLVSRAGQAAQAGDFDQAANLYRAALEQADEAQTRLNLAISLARAGDAAAAETEYRRVIADDPGRSEAYFALGTLLASQGRDLDAIPIYQQALERHPQDADTWLNLANALARVGRQPEAEHSYARVIELDPARSEARLGQARMLVGLQQWQAAHSALKEGLDVAPGDAGLALELARLLAMAPDAAVRDGAVALRVADRLFARESSLPHGLVLAAALAEVGQFDRAAQLQGELIVAARAQGRADLIDGLEQGLARYLEGRPTRLDEQASRDRN
jgi:tetratricopeptide (TPR) repeat protein